ncbi:hypothetical protein LR48_Vigan09g043000 [Vigna angularis]|uniref:Uncharacterized protein n=1 Tax=Phaseolus angularis TaxID=3914 RepID=A0A0L9V9L3_PHAAN|nr:hypothetical protein LR48_Vigan09g043000 [Vigna angularis]
MWLSFTGLKEEGYMSHERNYDLNKWTKKKKIYKDCLRNTKRQKVYKMFLHDGMKKEEKMCAFVLAWVILPRRGIRHRLTTEELFLLHAIKTRIPTNWVVAMSDHMIEIARLHDHNLPYGVIISSVLKHHQVDLIGENKVRCIKSNEISKAALTFIGLKKTEDGWVFRDEAEPSSVNETPSTFTPHTEFERFVVDQFQRLSTIISKVEKFVIRIH